MRIKNASPQDRDQLLEGLSFDNWLHESSSTSRQDSIDASASSLTSRQEHALQSGLQPGSHGLLIYHGPTSIYRTQGPSSPSLKSASISSEANFEYVAQHFGIDLQDGLIQVALTQFFRWQYPHFMFIYREAFLRDHFGERNGSKYWSLPLLLSICALGIVMSHDINQRRMGEQFYAAAESIIIVSGLAEPSITTVQVFLCLAFYQIGQGNLSKGWGLSGT